jgi:hypothetical protein
VSDSSDDHKRLMTLAEVARLATIPASRGPKRQCVGLWAQGGCSQIGTIRTKSGKWYCREHEPQQRKDDLARQGRNGVA